MLHYQRMVEGQLLGIDEQRGVVSRGCSGCAAVVSANKITPAFVGC
jgi:hypothetical protein